MSEKKQTERQQMISDIFLKYRSYIHYVALMNAPDDHIADDIVQDVYLIFIEESTQWDLSRDPRPLLRGITLNIAKKHWEKHLRTLPKHLIRLAERLQKETSSLDTPLTAIIQNEERSTIRVCIDKLTQKSRVLIERHYYDNVSLAEIAEESGVNVNTLYYRINQIRIVLKKCVENVLRMGIPHV